MWPLKVLVVLIIATVLWDTAYAQLAPLPSEAGTVARWNFDTDESDSEQDPIDGVATQVTRAAVPGLPSTFLLGLEFLNSNSKVDLGPVSGTKIDFTEKTEFRVDAIIHLTSNAEAQHIIYSAENIRFFIVNNQLAGAIRLPEGIVGLVSETNLSLNQSYRVEFHYRDNHLLLKINNRLVSKLILQGSIEKPEYVDSHAYIGNDDFGKFFPGYIDDVRVSNATTVDYTDPTMTLVEPAYTTLPNARPEFLINLQDNVGINASAIEVKLNGVIQNGITKTGTSIQGLMDDDLQPGILNEVKVTVSDLDGNQIEKKFFFIFMTLQDRGRIQPDANTLALWYMDEETPSDLLDASSNENHGTTAAIDWRVVNGIFGLGKNIEEWITDSYFELNNHITFTNKFTVEGWFRPYLGFNQFARGIFDNKQVTISTYRGAVYVEFHRQAPSQNILYQSQVTLLPEGELHHLAITWDASLPNNQLKIYIDGDLRESFQTTLASLKTPQPEDKTWVLPSYMGFVDEVRVSNIARTAFGIPTFEMDTIIFTSLDSGGLNQDFPVFDIALNSSAQVNVSSIKLRLNGVEQPETSNLVFAERSIHGTTSDPTQIGLNTIEVEFRDSIGNHRVASKEFYRFALQGMGEYETDADTYGLWHFNSGLEDDSGNANHLQGDYAQVEGVFGNGSYVSSYLFQVLPICDGFTFEGYFKISTVYPYPFEFFRYGYNYISLTANPATGDMTLNSSYSWNNYSKNFLAAFPVDGNYHHVALIYMADETKFVLVVDGEAKGSFKARFNCGTSGDSSISLGHYTSYVSYDEVRLSTVPRFSFNLPAQLSQKKRTKFKYQKNTKIIFE